MYEDKGMQYYSHVRHEIAPLIPANCERILEIGCGQGDTLLWLKNTQPHCQWLGGVELFPDPGRIAQERLDWFCAGNIETLDLPIEKGSLDLILCLDVLEHLVDPWAVVAKLHTFLKPGGAIVASIPNVRFFRASLDLVVFGNWQYTQEGILDKTHLRFFTKKTAIDLMQSSGLHCDQMIGKGLEKGRKARWLNFLTCGLLQPFFEFQYLIRVTQR
jgi:2-polyprenyl-3-methyl-5-hydroxy-6-metoxy-1,4-benzoquinol methylase